jgi:hypothetical protein
VTSAPLTPPEEPTPESGELRPELQPVGAPEALSAGEQPPTATTSVPPAWTLITSPWIFGGYVLASPDVFERAMRVLRYVVISIAVVAVAGVLILLAVPQAHIALTWLLTTLGLGTTGAASAIYRRRKARKAASVVAKVARSRSRKRK